MEGPDVLYRYRDAIEGEIVRVLSPGASELDEMMRYQMGWTDGGPLAMGKCLRPSLCLLACEVLGGDTKAALPVAVAIELVHNFSLIHDDIEDNDDTRHHRPTVWNAYGREKAVAAGLALWTKAYEVLDAAVDQLPAERVLESRRLLTAACQDIIEGQHLDLTFELRTDLVLPEYIDMISRKTGALLSASLRIGAVLAGANETQAALFGDYGLQLGLAFQIRDDILGIWGEGSATGKPVGADISRRKKTLPVVHAFEQTVGPDHDLLIRTYSGETVADDDIDAVLSILQRWNCRYFAQGLAEDYRARAMSALSRANISPDARRRFDELLSFVLERDY